MASYYISFACGHTKNRQLLGKHEGRYRYIEWASERGSCSACRKANVLAAAEETEMEHFLPCLSGLEKQVSWARAIRARKIGEFSDYCREVRRCTTAERLEALDAEVERIVEAMREKNSASASMRGQRVLCDEPGLCRPVPARYDLEHCILNRWSVVVAGPSKL